MGTHPQSPSSGTAPAPRPGLVLKLPPPRWLPTHRSPASSRVPTGGRDISVGLEDVTRTYRRYAPFVTQRPSGTPRTSKDTRHLWVAGDGQEDSHRHLRRGSVSVTAPTEVAASSSSLELLPGQMHIAAHQTPSPCSSLYLAVPLHAVGIDQPTGSISRFLLQYLSAPSISQSAPLSAMPVYTSSIYLCRLHRSRR